MKPEKMKFIRKKQLRLSQRELGELLGYSNDYIGMIERGRAEMPLSFRYALAWILHFGSKDPFEDK